MLWFLVLSRAWNGDFLVSSSYIFLDFIFKKLFLYNKQTCIKRGYDFEEKNFILFVITNTTTELQWKFGKLEFGWIHKAPFWSPEDFSKVPENLLYQLWSIEHSLYLKAKIIVGIRMQCCSFLYKKTKIYVWKIVKW